MNVLVCKAATLELSLSAAVTRAAAFGTTESVCPAINAAFDFSPAPGRFYSRRGLFILPGELGEGYWLFIPVKQRSSNFAVHPNPWGSR